MSRLACCRALERLHTLLATRWLLPALKCGAWQQVLCRPSPCPAPAHHVRTPSCSQLSPPACALHACPTYPLQPVGHPLASCRHKVVPGLSMPPLKFAASPPHPPTRTPTHPPTPAATGWAPPCSSSRWWACSATACATACSRRSRRRAGCGAAGAPARPSALPLWCTR